MRAVLTTCARITANPLGQRLLRKGIAAAHYLQGVGSGADVMSSGETAVFAKLREAGGQNRPLCIFDVGANTGQYVNLARACLNGRQFHIHSFEPGRTTYAALCGATKAYSNVTLNNIGLGREAGEMELYYDSPGSGLASLTKRDLAHFGITMALSEHVRIETLDGYCRDRGIDRIDLLKLDVEGHELDVLAGAEQMFSRSAIGMVQFEFGGCNIDTRTFFRDFFCFFANHGMRIARMTPTGHLCEISSYSESEEQFTTTNFLSYPAPGH